MPHVYYLEAGGHDFKVWKNGLYMFSQFLFKPVDVAALPTYTVLGTPAATNVRNAKYPQLLPDNRAVFRLKAPGVRQAQLDLGRKYDMVKDSTGTWTVTTDTLSRGLHYYSLVLDGLPIADPASDTFYGMGRMASGIEVPGHGTGFTPCATCPTARCASGGFSPRSPIRGAGFLCTRRRATTPTPPPGTRCCTCCTAAAKTKPAGPGKAKPT
ncbi:hypothetical protein ACFQT0_20655 [Hymenobacter humi]|uniref:Uncharacterized protein n=1 Tax=Hymenobacter humi TaxID=1411620 RepID=A0ABW2UAS2_9BACT